MLLGIFQFGLAKTIKIHLQVLFIWELN